MDLRQLSEKGLIAAIRHDFGSAAEDLIRGIGDDAAVIRTGDRSMLVTKDLLVEDSHFITTSHPPDLLGRKSISVNLSDIAAMGGIPRFALLGLGLPSGCSTKWIGGFFSGIKAASDEYGVILIGGDVTRAEKILISVTMIGESDRVVYRSGAKPGDSIWVSGTLGDSALGLVLMKEGVTLGAGKDSDICLQAFYDPRPQVELGKFLGREEIPSAMIDISDGLSIDLSHVCEESGVGAEINSEYLPLSPLVKQRPDRGLDLALHGGEDYQLLLTVPTHKEGRIRLLAKKFQLSRIGRIISGRTIFLIDKNGNRTLIPESGFQHFD